MKFSAFVLMIAVVMVAAALGGCTSTSSPPPTVVNTPVPTETQVMTPVVTVTPLPTTVMEPDTAAKDKKFADALDACYAEIPVVSDVTSRIALTECIQNAPNPSGVCAVNYMNNVGRFLKDDDTTAGYARMMTRIQKARDAYANGLTYNYVTDTTEECSPQPLGYPV